MSPLVVFTSVRSLSFLVWQLLATTLEIDGLGPAPCLRMSFIISNSLNS